MSAADPAVDAEELDSVGFAAQRAFSGCRQPQLESCEEPAVAERRRRRKLRAVLGFEEPRLSLPERREGSVEPGVAEERSLLESLRGNERGRRCAGAGGDRLERDRSVRESPSAGAGSSSSNRRSAGARNGSCAVSRVAHSTSVVGSGAWKAAQALAAA